MNIKKRSRKSRIVFFVLSIFLGVAAFIFTEDSPELRAAPVLSVGVSCGDALLGDNISCTATFTNSGADKGYGLSFSGVFSSSLADPDGQVSIVQDPDYPYSSQQIDSGTGDTTVTWVDVADLAAGESFDFNFVVNPDELTGWDVAEVLTASFSAELFESPALVTPVAGADSDTATLLAINMTKSFNQSTSQQQATGAVNQFSFTLTTTNNSVTATDVTSLRDDFPDGLEFAPINDPNTACTVAPTSATQNPDETWDLEWLNYDGNADGTFDPGESVSITCDVFIRYDYEQNGAVVQDDTVFQNDAEMDYEYPSGLPTIIDTINRSDTVTGTFLTINKTDNQSDFGTSSDNTIVYTIAYEGSEYYTYDTIQFTDELGDGHIFCSGAGLGYDPKDALGEIPVADCTQAPSIPITSVTENSPSTGQITIVWDIASLPANTSGSYNFQTVVASSYGGVGGGSLVVAGDSLSNSIAMTYNYNDDTGGSNDGNDSEGSSSSTPAVQPSIDKTVCHPELTGGATTCEDADFVDTARDVVVGDEVIFRVNFIGTNNINMKDIMVTDWIPTGFNVTSVTENPGGACTSSPVGNFVNGDPNTETTGTAFGLDYISWNLGDVTPGTNWCAEIVADVQDVPQIQEGQLKSNLFKSQGSNVYDDPYSDRDGVDLNVGDPHLILAKAGGVDVNGGNVLPGDLVEYTVTIDNDQSGIAKDVFFRDTLPEGMRGTTPTIQSITLDATPLVLNADYETSYSSGSGEFDIDFNTASVETNIGENETITIVYRTTIDAGLGAGVQLDNIASVSYNTQDDGSGRQVNLSLDTADDNTDDGTISLAELSVEKTVTATPITVGESTTFNFDITIPAELIAYNINIADTNDRDGFSFGSAATSVQSGSCSFPGGTGPWSENTSGNNNDVFNYPFNGFDVDNSASGTDCVIRVELTAVYTGIDDDGSSWEFWSSLSGASGSQNNDNVAAVNYSSTDASSNDLVANSGSVRVDIDQPEIVASKSHSPSGPFQGNDTFQYTVTGENVGYSDAYDIRVYDTLPSDLELVSIDSVLDESASVITGYTDNSVIGGQVIDIDFNGSSIDPLTESNGSDEFTITYTVRVDGNVGAGQTLVNDVDIDWRSLDGAGRNYDEDVESEEDFSGDETTDSIDIVDADIVKSITAGSDITIGETTTFEASVTIPAETVAYWPDIVDVLNRDGYEYVAGSATVGNFSGDLDGADVVTFVDSGTGTANAADVSTNTTGTNNTSFSFDLNTIDNADDGSSEGDSDFTFDLVYQARYIGLEDNGTDFEFWNATALDQMSDAFTLNWNSSDGGNGTTNQSKISNAEITDIDQPVLEQDKRVEDPGSPGTYIDGPITVSGGDAIGYQAIIENTGWDTAYDITWQDDYDSTNMENESLASVELDADGNDVYETTLVEGTDFSKNFTGDPLTIDFDGGTSDTNLPAGGKIRIRYTMDTVTSVGSGLDSTNTVDVDWSSMDGVVAGERVYNDSAAETGSYNDDEDTATVQVPEPTIQKNTTISDPTIGDVFDYTVQVTVPSNSTVYNAEVTDTVPDGLTVLNASSATGSVSFGPEAGNGTTPVTWTIGDISNPPTTNISMTIQVRLDNQYDGAVDLDGLSVGVDGDAQDVINNEATLSWDDADTGGSTHQISDDVDITVTEPHIAIVKNFDESSAAAGETVGVEVVLTNDGTDNVYDLTWQDTLPAELFDSGSSPGSLSIEHSNGPTTLSVGADYTSNLSANPITVTLDAGVILQPTETLTITYDVVVSGGVSAGQSLQNTAQVNQYSSQPGTDANERTSGPHSAQDTLTAEAPALVTTKTLSSVDTHVQRGETVTYQYTIENVGNAPAINVDFSDTLPSDFDYVSGTTSVSWPLGSSTANPVGSAPTYTWNTSATLNPGQTLTATFDVLVGAGATFTTHTNTAAATAEDGGGSSVPADTGVGGDTDDDDQDTQDIIVTNPSVQITKELKSGQDQYVQNGETVEYDIQITNNGDTTLEVVPLSDTYNTSQLTYVGATPASNDNNDDGAINWSDITSSLGDIAPSNSVTVTVEFTASSPTNPVVNTAEVAAAVDENGDTPATVSDSENTLVITNPEVSITKELSSGQDPIVPLNGTVDFNVTIENTGDTTLEVIPLEDVYNTSFFSFQSATIAPDDPTDDGVLNWSDITSSTGDLAPTQSATITLSFQVEATGSDINTATVAGAIDEHGDTAPTDTDNDGSITVTNPNLALDKKLAIGQDAVIPLNGTVTYDIEIENIGGTQINVLPLRDTYDATLLEFQSATITPDIISSGVLEWNDLTTSLGDLASSGTHTVSVTFRVIKASLSNINTARVESAIDENDDSPPAIQDAEGTTTLTEPKIEIEKTLGVSHDEQLQIGDSISYTIQVTNTGTTVIDVLPLSDTFNDDELTFVSSTPSPTSVGSGEIVWSDLTTTFGNQANGGVVTVSVNFTVKEKADPIVNTATVENATDVNDDTPPTVSDDDQTAVVTNPSVSISKELGEGQKSFVDVNENITYVIEVTNNGDTVLDTVPLKDTFNIEELEFISADQTQTTVNDGEISWVDITGDGSLGVGEKITVTVVMKSLKTVEDVVNTAIVENAVDEYGDNPDDVTDTENTVTIFEKEKFVVTKTSDPGTDTVLLPGDVITYTVRYENNTDVPVSQVIATDPLAEAVEYNAGSIVLNGVSMTDEVDADAAFFDGSSRQVSATIGTVVSGGTGSLTFTVTVADLPKSEKGVLNKAIFGSEYFSDKESNETFHFVDPITITKDAADINGGDLEPGDEIRWVITVKNIGLSQTVDLLITDELPENVTYVAGSIVGPGSDDSDPRILRWRLGVLEVDEQVQFGFSTKVNDDVQNGERILNQAVVTSANSLPKKSDFPATSALDDPTILGVVVVDGAIQGVLARTGKNVRANVHVSMLALVVGGALIHVYRRRESLFMSENEQ